MARQLEVEILPDLPVANVRKLLRTALPLNQFSLEEATGLVVKTVSLPFSVKGRSGSSILDSPCWTK
ncbi:hypothetical protein M1N81_00920 [Dehalococcoidia bacterium]|nr:hypothetical protein [Dehalococcoidia bacterium]